MNRKTFHRILIPLAGLACTLTVQAREIHVDGTLGSDRNEGLPSSPLKSIQAAAERALPGDSVIVHTGVYREWVHPVHSGTESQPIVFMADPGERVEIKGSEEVKGWKRVDGDTWMLKLSNARFGAFNPYADTLRGDWLERGQWSHTGQVYINGDALREVPTLDSLVFARSRQPRWFARTGEDSTAIWATFPGQNPNVQTVEINVRQTVFYPERPQINYIHVRGFHMSHAATPWAPPTAEQPGLIGTHWSKGWVIEDNVVSHSKCVGITLGKYGDEWDNRAESAEGFVATTRRALQQGWNRATVGSHIVRRNHVSHCGQAGIAGSLGAIFSVVADNEVHDIGENQPFWGYEIAGIKFHAPVDMTLSGNHVHHCEAGIWLDWMTQGTRITRNLLHDNWDVEISLEVNHGPILVDNNLFLSNGLGQVKLSQGIAFVNNIIAWEMYPTPLKDGRETPYLAHHSTEIVGLHDCPCGNVSYCNNLFIRKDLTHYDECLLPVRFDGNLYLHEARPSRHDSQARRDTVPCLPMRVTQEADGWYLEIDVRREWKQPRRLVKVKDLGKALIPDQSFQREGVPAVFNKDYLGHKRMSGRSFPGAIEFKAEGQQRIKVYPLHPANET